MNKTYLESASSSLDCDLHDVSFGCATDKQSALAFAHRNQVKLARQVLKLQPAAQRAIVAHELAHVAQKRRGTLGLPRALFQHPVYRLLLEVDAAIATADILCARKVGSLLPDDPEAVSYWGPAGHYWTSLTVMLAAGMELNTALRRAFFCQMPDQVLEFDAIAAAVDYKLPTQYVGSVPVLGQRATPSEEFYNSELELSPALNMEVSDISVNILPRLAVTLPWEASGSAERRAMLNRDISSGLHCLTGRRGADEVAFRAKNSRQYAPDPVAFGISLHCFGDSYSHQNAAGDMYPPITGHGRDGHAPDSLHAHQSQYLAYVSALYGLIKSCFGGVERVALPNLLAGLQAISDMEFEGNDEQINAQQSAVLRTFCIGLNLAPSSALNYRPETEKISYWRNFHPKHTTILAPEGQAKVFELARSLGRLWNTT